MEEALCRLSLAGCAEPSKARSAQRWATRAQTTLPAGSPTAPKPRGASAKPEWSRAPRRRRHERGPPPAGGVGGEGETRYGRRCGNVGTAGSVGSGGGASCLARALARIVLTIAAACGRHGWPRSAHASSIAIRTPPRTWQPITASVSEDEPSSSRHASIPPAPMYSESRVKRPLASRSSSSSPLSPSLSPAHLGPSASIGSMSVAFGADAPGGGLEGRPSAAPSVRA